MVWISRQWLLGVSGTSPGPGSGPAKPGLGPGLNFFPGPKSGPGPAPDSLVPVVIFTEALSDLFSLYFHKRQIRAMGRKRNGQSKLGMHQYQSAWVWRDEY